MASSTAQQDVEFTNSKGEKFHMSVFPRKTQAADVDGPPPVLFCVHGAGMSGDNFYRLADYLQCEGRGFSTTSSFSSFSSLPPTAGAGESGLPSQQYHPVIAPGRTPLVPPAAMSLHHATVRPVMRVHPTTPATLVGPAGDCTFMPPRDAPSSDEIGMAVVTCDLRCHGTSTYAGGEDHLTLDVLVADFQAVLAFAKTSLFPSSDFYVLGHSLGGSIVAQGLSTKDSQARIAGVILVDVVEGTARMSLKHMHDFLAKRPESFESVRDAETWFLRHGGMRTPDGAAVSVPPLLKQDPQTQQYVWRSDLGKMEAVWDDWFNGLDKAFVSLPFPKMLCLANAERLDTELTVAQMQGKFQFEIMGNSCGHYVMDDATVTLGTKLMRFVKRIQTVTRKLKMGIKPGMTLHLINTTVPASRLDS